MNIMGNGAVIGAWTSDVESARAVAKSAGKPCIVVACREGCTNCARVVEGALDTAALRDYASANDWFLA